MLKCDICGKKQGGDNLIEQDVFLTKGHPKSIGGGETLHTFDLCFECIETIRVNGVKLELQSL